MKRHNKNTRQTSAMSINELTATRGGAQINLNPKPIAPTQPTGGDTGTTTPGSGTTTDSDKNGLSRPAGQLV